MKGRKAAFFDVDGTLTAVHTWEGIHQYFKMKGEKRLTYIRFWVTHTFLYLLFKIGLISQLSLRSPWAAHLGWFIKDLTPKQADEVWDWVVEEFFRSNWHAHSIDLLKKHKESGDYIVLVSASPAPLVRKVGQHLGADMAIGTEFELRKGRYTGRNAGEVCIGENKAKMPMERLAETAIEIDYVKSYAYADSSGDIDMLEMVGKPVALNPDDVLRPIAAGK